MRGLRYWQLALGFICLVGAGCQTPNEKLEAEKQKAAVNIGKAEQKVERVREAAEKQIEGAQGAAVDEAKIEATKEIGEAKREVGDEKVEATENIADAEEKAKTDPDPQLP